MAFSKQTHTGDGVTTDFAVSFAYLDETHVAVRVDKEFTTEIGAIYTFEFTTPTVIRVTKVIGGAAPDASAEIEFIRQTPIATPAVVFPAGSSLSTTDLNTNSEYLTYALQEATDANEEFTKLYLGAFAAAPTTDNDGGALQVGAVYYDTVTNALYYYTTLSTWIVGESTLAAETAATAAEAAQTAAEVAQTAAELAETNAQTAQTAAETAQTNAETAETNAQTAETGALAAQAAAEAVYDSFDDRYLGTAAANPALDNDGDPLVAGALYFNTVSDTMKVYSGSAWGEVIGDALIPTNNLSDLDNAATARTNLGLAAGATADAASQAEAEAGVENTKFLTSLRTKQAVDALVPAKRTLLGSLDFTGLSSAALTSLDLTGYDFIEFTVERAGVSTNSIETRFESQLIFRQPSSAGGSFRHGCHFLIDLATGDGWGNIGKVNGSLVSAEYRPAIETSLSTASTSVTFTTSSGTWAEGDAKIYGVIL